ncbi:MAG: ABC transporter, partial [Acidobacteria bacterium]
TVRNIKYGDNQVNAVFTQGTTDEFLVTSIGTFSQGRFFSETESRGGANIVVLGYDVAEALFPSEPAVGKTVLIDGNPFRVIGVWTKMGTFLGLFSFDSYAVVPLPAFTKTFSSRLDTSIRVKVKDKEHLEAAKDELVGHMRRVRGLRPEQPNDFEINDQGALRSTLGPIKGGIAVAGLFVTAS